MHEGVSERPNIFPATAVTWLEERIRGSDASGFALARTHVMSVYLEPLVIYVRGSSYRRLGDPVDLVQGFFENRLARDDYLDKWIESGLPLRVWLIKGLKFYIMETTRRGPNDRLREMPDEAPGDGADGPATDFRKELARGLVREALRIVSEELEAEGLGEHWRVFSLHHLEGHGYASIGASVGVTEERAMVMGRTATRRLRKRLRQMCAWPGASDQEIDRELVSMFD